MIKWYKMTQNQLVDEMEDLTQVGKFGCNDTAPIGTLMVDMKKTKDGNIRISLYSSRVSFFGLYMALPNDPILKVWMSLHILYPANLALCCRLFWLSDTVSPFLCATWPHVFVPDPRCGLGPSHQRSQILHQSSGEWPQRPGHLKKTHSRPIHQPAWSPTQWIITLVTTVAL